MTLRRRAVPVCVRYDGFTLVELVVVLAIAAILAMMAVSSFSNITARNRVVAATEALYGLLIRARAEGSVRDRDLTVTLNAGAWCAGVSSSGVCDCTSPDDCTLDVAGTAVTRVVDGGDFPGVSISENFAGGGPTFRRPRGNTNRAGSVELTEDDWALKIIVSVPGRIRICNPNDNLIPGYESC